ncbi:response regulator [Metabacillus halosaccharovorans]|uniref:response regulator n=1 Tax=Metabacillus halosaccharovorans TaxID=930124 RepID=UPI001C1FBAFB|nr:response regulator [Metabacillus halosaccharovorans]MBU7594631.1 response regulator [Metabacillus halosaccharovorans]
MKALMIDDEINVRFVMKQLGEWAKYGITTLLEAANGQEAKRIIEKESPEIIFTDIKMPGMNGMELIEWLHANSYTGKVIFITGYDDYSFMRKAIQFSSFDYLLKPIEAEPFNNTLAAAVEAWKKEEKERNNKEDGDMEGIKRFRMNQVVTQACIGEHFDELEIASFLPNGDQYELTLISFYQMHHAEPYVQQLADELMKQGWGNAFALQHDSTLCLVMSNESDWILIEEWISQQFDIPIRLVSGKPISFLNEIPGSFRDLQREMEGQNYRSIHRVNDLDDARRMQDIVAYVEMYYMEELSLEKLANRFFLSREHISRKFKQQTGLPLSKYVMNLRINQAKTWLIETEESILSISIMLGYQDEKYFSKLFKKVVGMTPFEYRNAKGKQALTSRECETY